MARSEDTDDLSIEVVPTNGEPLPAPMPRRNPKQKRNPADDIIESGEINSERRSMVVRSSPSLPTITEEQARVAMPPAPKKSLRAIWLIVALLAGGGALATLTVKPKAKKVGPSNAVLVAIAEMIGTTLDTESAATLDRAAVIASSPMVRAAIQTDASTLADMAKDKDVMFRREDKQVIEVFQITGTDRHLFLRLPEGAALVPPPAGQTAIAFYGDLLGTVATAKIEPVKDAVISGEVVTWRPFDIKPIVARFGDDTKGAKLDGLAKPVVFQPDGATTNVSVPVLTKLTTDKPLALSAFVATPKASVQNLVPIQLALAATAFLALVTFLILVIRARRA